MNRTICAMVWRDMLVQLRNYKWFEKKENSQASNKFWALYVFIVIPIIWQLYQHKKVAVFYYSLIIMMCVTMMMSEICPMRLPKIIYLCPMSAGERRKYLITSYVIKIVLSVLVCAAVSGILMGFGYLTWIESIFIILAFMMLAVSVNLAGGRRTFQPSNEMDRALKKKCSGYHLWMILQQIVSIAYVAAFFLVGIGMEEGEHIRTLEAVKNIPWVVVVLWVIFTLLNLLLTLKVLSYFKPTAEVVMNYEMVYETGSVRRSAS